MLRERCLGWYGKGNSNDRLGFYRGKKILITGHTGFKGSLAFAGYTLANSGAVITGYSLEVPTNPNLFTLAEINNNITSVIGDIRRF